MPQATQQHRRHQCGVGARLAVAVAAQRDVEIVAQPCRQGDVPASPEIGKSDRRIGKAEVVRHRETQAQRRADRGGRVTGKIAEDLAAESERRDPRIQRARNLVAVVDHLRGCGQKTVGEHDLLEQAERHQRQSETQHIRAGAARLRELRHQFSRAHDRPSNQMREEGHEQRIVEEVGCRLGAAQIHIERVGHRCKGVERDADRQHDIECRRFIGDAQRRHEVAEIGEQESAVFEIAEHAQVGDNRQQHPCAPHGRLFGVDELLRGIPVDHRRHPQQNHEWRIPRRVKQVTCDQEVDFLRGPAERHRVQSEHNREEHHEGERVENHPEPLHAAER